MTLSKRIFRYLSSFKGNIALVFIFNILYAFFSLFSLGMVIPFLSVLFGRDQTPDVKPEIAFNVSSISENYLYYMGQIIQTSGTVKAMIVIGITMIAFSFLSNLFRYLGHYCLAPVRAGVLNSFRKDIYQKIITLPLSFYNKHKKGDILNRMGADVQEIEWSVISTVQIMCRDPFMLMLYLITLFSVNIKLTIISLIILPLSGILIALIGKSIKRYSTKAQNVLGKLSSRFEEAISGLRVIKGYSAIDFASSNFKNENRTYTKTTTKLFRINELGAPLIEFLSILSMTSILLIGTGFVLRDAHFQGEIFVMYIVVFARMLPPAKQLVTAYYNIQKGSASGKRISEILDANKVITEDNTPIGIDTFSHNIEYRDVSFNYQEADGICREESESDALKHISFSIKKGDSIALTGPSGGGKSTLVDLLPRFYDILRGEILIDDNNIKKYRLNDLRSLFGIVNQDVILFNDSVYNNLTFGMKNVSREEVIEAAKMAQAHSFIMNLSDGYDTMIGDRGMKLSGGERQRLSIARTILRKPQILILDEATSALDNESEYLLQEALESLIKGKTLIIIAHRLSTIRNVKQILFVENGKITETGSHQELLKKNGAYNKFCSSQEMR